MRILVVDDEKDLAAFLKSGLEHEGYAVDVAFDGECGQFLATTNDYDLMILDIVLPKKSGKEVCRAIRADGKSYPIIALTVKSEIDSKVDLFRLGVDDYMTKPFSFEELSVRIKAILRRPQRIEDCEYRIGDLVINSDRNIVIRDGKEITLTRKEFSLLEYLAMNKDRVVSRSVLMEHVWDVNANQFSNTVETHMRNLRSKVDRSYGKKLIHTVSGRGYKLSAD